LGFGGARIKRGVMTAWPERGELNVRRRRAGVAQVVTCLPCKLKALSSTFSTAKK
jgi:hypothetical protein